MTDETPDPAREDQIHRQAVFGFLLLEARLATIEEIVVNMQAPCRSPKRQRKTRDATERAVRDLAAMGVLNIEGKTVYVSRAAQQTARLLEGHEPDTERWR